ncbi:MAG: site-specific integrase [Pirellulales bacterium]
MVQRPLKVPSYRHYKPKNLGVVRINGRDIYLGRYDSAESWQKYHQLIAAFLSGVTDPTLEDSSSSPPPPALRVKELALKYFEFAEIYYRKVSKSTSELNCIRAALRRLLKLYADLPVPEFSPLKLKLVREEFIREGNCRLVVNRNISRIRRMFRWGVENEIVPVTVLQGLLAVAGLKKGRSEAAESEPVKPVTPEIINATLPHLSPTVRAMISVQWLSGMRPGEVCQMRPMDIDQSGEVWCYRPESHKTAHHGLERRIYLGPRAQEVLRPYLDRDAEACCFSPAEAEEQRRAAKHAKRRTPLRYGNRPGTKKKSKPKRTPGTSFSVASYRRAIDRACQIAKVATWSPNQLRHARATELRRQFGLDAAQVVLGHQDAIVTQIYAERDFKRAEELMKLSG